MVTSADKDFKVTWQDPAAAQETWLFDTMHFQTPLAPLTWDFHRAVHLTALNARTVYVNNYAFMTFPMPPPPTEDIIKRGVLDVWQNDYMPVIREHVHKIRTTDYEALGLPELADMGQALLDATVAAFLLTMKPITGFMGPTFGLVHFLQEEIGPQGPQMAASLLQGFDNSTAAAGAGLSDLAEEAVKRPAVADALREGRYDTLEQIEGGPDFLAAFQQYLDEFGWRPNSWGEMHAPTWAENPRLPLMLIARYISDPALTPSVALERSVQQREVATDEVRAQISQGKRPQLEALVEAARAHVPISEGRALWQHLIIGVTRIPFLALGRKLVAAGALDQPDDVFFLTIEELKEAGHNPTPATKPIVAERRADFSAAGDLKPPPFLGSPPDLTKLPPEVAAGVGPLMHLFFGADPPNVEGKRIKGQAASKGVVRGRARVIHDLTDAERLQKGEVLVCVTTAPPWTPLFSIAGAVVTDSGGVLSHSAICAREYAIPCVVATQVSTHIIPDGAMISVDGSEGTVTIEG